MTLPWMAAKNVLRPVAELRPHAGNARVHSAEQLEQIKASMLAFGFTNPLLVDEAGVLIAGHGRLEAASALRMAKVPVIVLRHLSAAQKEALRLADMAGRRAGSTSACARRSAARPPTSEGCGRRTWWLSACPSAARGWAARHAAVMSVAEGRVEQQLHVETNDYRRRRPPQRDLPARRGENAKALAVLSEEHQWDHREG